MKKPMQGTFNRFDILEAYFLFGSLYHGGQGTKEYAYIGRCLNLGFKPAMFLADRANLSPNGRNIFDTLRYNFMK